MGDPLVTFVIANDLPDSTGSSPSYEDSSGYMQVDPATMYQLANGEVLPLARSVADSIGAIHDVWRGLSVGWVGETAAQAQEFSEDWVAAIAQLFGTVEAPETGILAQIAGGVILAAGNYDQAETGVTDMFQRYAETLAAAGEGGGEGHEPVTEGPIIEVY